MVDSINEKRLLTELKNGSFHAFERLYNMYSGKLYNFIMRISSGNQYMAEEVVQSAFIRVWEVRERVEPEFSLYHRQEFINEYVSASDCRVCLQ